MQTEQQNNMTISIRKILAVIILIFTCGFITAQDCVSMYFDATEDGDDVVVQLKVDNFQDILISQFALTYSYLNLELKEIQGNAEINLNGTHLFSKTPGYISVSWSNPVNGQTLADGSVLLEMRFTVLVDDHSEFSLDPNFNTEFINGFFEEVCLEATPAIINETKTQLVGKLLHDLNGNCAADPTDFPLSGWTVLIDGGLEKYYRVTDEFGFYHVPVDIGNYTIEVLEKSDLWNTCEGPILVTVENAGEIIQNSFVVSPVSPSSALEVVVSSSEIRRCFDNVYSIKYKNNGTAVAQASKIELTIDENLEYVSTNTGNFSIDGQVITFNLGNIRPGDGGDFQIVFNADCSNLESGQTLCVEANISSNDIVIPPVNWGGAVLTTEATCEGDSVVFRIENVGTTAMDIPLQSIVVEDDVMFGENEVDLEPQEAITFKHSAGGGVYRVLVAQEEGYPLGNFSTDFIEFCNGGASETYQFVSMFQNEDESPYRDIECQQVRDMSQGNNMSAFPVGYREEHLINQNEDIEYTIYFQNVETDTVENIYIESLIDESLDIETLVAGSSSHDYTVSIKEDRILRFEFRNIQLPNAVTSEIESNGFIKFRLSQHKDVPIGTMINGVATIHFDLQGGVSTNLIDHLVGEEFIEIVLSNKDLLDDDAITIGPNPAFSFIRIEVPVEYNDLSYVLYDNKGSIVNAANVSTNAFYIYKDFIQDGIYYLEMRSENKVLKTKKIVFQNR